MSLPVRLLEGPRPELDAAGVAWDAFASIARERAGRDVRIRVGPLPSVDADPSVLEEIFAALLSIALRLTETRRPAEILVGARGGTFYVSDNGAGVGDGHTAETLERVERIVAAHGGHVRAELVPGEGATTFFTLAGDLA